MCNLLSHYIVGNKTETVNWCTSNASSAHSWYSIEQNELGILEYRNLWGIVVEHRHKQGSCMPWQKQEGSCTFLWQFWAICFRRTVASLPRSLVSVERMTNGTKDWCWLRHSSTYFLFLEFSWEARICFRFCESGAYCLGLWFVHQLCSQCHFPRGFGWVGVAMAPSIFRWTIGAGIAVGDSVGGGVILLSVVPPVLGLINCLAWPEEGFKVPVLGFK